MGRDFTVTAIVAAFNEEDIIGQIVADLTSQGILVYFIDHGSTDDTVAQVQPYLRRGVLHIERFVSHGTGDANDGWFAWQSILKRKEQLASELDSDWFIHHDADELRESPWPRINLFDAIHQVDELGYSAIDFELLNFRPTHNEFRRGDDLRDTFRFYEPGAAWDKVQIRCWKKADSQVDIASSGGHDARFPDRRIFPIRFLLRHYPIRSQAHGERKVFQERRGRFVEAERQAGWHVQYNQIAEGHSFIRDASTLTPYDPAAVRLHVMLHHREVEELQQRLGSQIATLDETLEQERRDREAVTRELKRELEARQRELEARQRELDAKQRELDAKQRELDARQQELAVIYRSRSWRWTAPLRAARRFLHRR